MLVCRMTLTMSDPDRLQEQLEQDSGFLQQFYLDTQMQLNSQLQHHGVDMVTDNPPPKLLFTLISP